jgi:hypothetical protein
MFGVLFGGAGLFGTQIPVTDGNVLEGLSLYNWVCNDESISSVVNGASLGSAVLNAAEVKELRCEYRADPLGIDALTFCEVPIGGNN